jgi:hypothetical protein
MADNSAIEWTEATWNPVTGCDKVSPGCAHQDALHALLRPMPGLPTSPVRSVRTQSNASRRSRAPPE